MHSCWSPDSSTTLTQLATTARQVGLHRIALTDHNTAEGALELKALEPELAIVGEEVKTSEGEIIGLFLTRSLARGGTPEEVCDEIRSMGGLTYACHPLDRRRASFSSERLLQLRDRLDIIETYNPWADPAANRAAAELCRELGLVAASGSDSHGLRELGKSWMEIEPYADPASFLASLRHAGHVVSPGSGRGGRY
ncbi:MAG: PHP-associated domain-containing protein [Candidatus Dormibacter sp.]|uniref:PHP-associated domain-containing protein n=1 Tax=Candidatus Dormibacter sp. TaxID=2973982 RepID=UPI0026AA5152